MATDPHIHEGEHNDLRISRTSDPKVVEVELFHRRDRRGLFTEVPVAKLRSMIDAALTEPPARPEWADLEDVLDAGWPEGINGAENGHIARTLHEGGVRVVTEEQP